VFVAYAGGATTKTPIYVAGLTVLWWASIARCASRTPRTALLGDPGTQTTRLEAARQSSPHPARALSLPCPTVGGEHFWAWIRTPGSPDVALVKRAIHGSAHCAPRPFNLASIKARVEDRCRRSPSSGMARAANRLFEPAPSTARCLQAPRRRCASWNCAHAAGCEAAHRAWPVWPGCPGALRAG
jgi:hypothetical protein